MKQGDVKMAENTNAMQVQEQEMIESDGTERMRERATFIPRADIYETDEIVVVTVDMPGVREDTIDITLENNTLTILGNSVHGAPEGYTLAFAEYEAGDYERSFRITDRIDREGIEAVYKHGVLTLNLPKADVAKTRKISVKAG
jgi:HSP20 family molecular chaperone IbpA